MFTRRNFVTTGMATIGFPMIVPARVLGKESPSHKIHVGLIGCGRIAHGMDLPGLALNQDLATLVGLSDCDRLRMNGMEKYAKALFEKKNLPQLQLATNYRELLANPDVDAVMICTPDFSHAEICVAAMLAGKDVYVQKPLAMTIEESRTIAEIAKKTGRVFHIGSQQRSEGRNTLGPQFRQAVDYVRDGRIGKVLRVEVGLPYDGSEPADWPLVEPIPATFDFDRWLGCAPLAPYSQLRTHHQGRKDKADFNARPGWMTIQAYDMGMIANWGAHHLDIVQWALNTESTGPVEAAGHASYPKRRLWDTHGRFDVTLTYADRTAVHVAGDDVYPVGERFIGEDGWIFCSRGSAKATESDPVAAKRHGYWRPLEASDPKLIQGEVAHPVCRNTIGHHRVWLESIRSRKPTNIPVETAHRSTSACILAYTAMKLGRPLKWDPAAERFVNDEEANKTLSRPERAPYGMRNVIKELGVRS